MIIGNPIIVGVSQPKASINVTAKAGALLNLHYKDSSIILKSYQLGAGETQHTFAVNMSETAYVVEDVSNSASVEVLVDAVAQYSVKIKYILWLYKDGDECTNITGGWAGYAYASSNDMSASQGYSAGTISVTKNSSNIVCRQSTQAKSGSLFANNKINLSGYTKLCMDYTNTPYDCIDLRVASSKGNSYDTVATRGINMSSNHSELDISSIHDSKYVCVNIRRPYSTGGATTVTISKIWLE